MKKEFTRRAHFVLPLYIALVAGCTQSPDESKSDTPLRPIHALEFEFTEKTETLAIVLADLNGDTHPDLLEGIAGAPNQVYINNGTEDPFLDVAPTIIAGGNRFTIDVVLSDIDQDGDLDMLEAALGKNFFRINSGSATQFKFEPAAMLNSDNYPTYTLAVTDLNGDNYPDLIVGNSQKHTNQLMMNVATPPYFAHQIAMELGIDKDTTEEILLVDVNGDGNLDLLAANAGEPNRIYINSGEAPYFSTSTNIVEKPYYGFSITTGDVNGDGKLDIVCGNLGKNCLFLNAGDRYSTIEFGDDQVITRSVILYDIDNDTHPDLIVGNQDGQNRIFWNTGASPYFTLDNSQPFGSPDSSTRTMRLADVNSDGRPEIVVGNAGGQANQILSIPSRNEVH